MIKAVLGHEKDGKEIKMLLLGLSYANLDYLRNGRPIHITETEMSDLSIPGIEVMVFADKTEEKIQTELEKRFTVGERVTRQ
jgi:hypothetical protein